MTRLLHSQRDTKRQDSQLGGGPQRDLVDHVHSVKIDTPNLLSWNVVLFSTQVWSIAVMEQASLNALHLCMKGADSRLTNGVKCPPKVSRKKRTDRRRAKIEGKDGHEHAHTGVGFNDPLDAIT